MAESRWRPVIMGRAQLTVLPAGTYDNAAILLLTDGIENRAASIADAVAAGATDNRTFAIGLGNESRSTLAR
jgi:hypothetical protein